MGADDLHLNILTIDGPAGVGKSSVAREVARRLACFHLDTGAMYRAVTLLLLRHGLTAATVGGAAGTGHSKIAPLLARLAMRVEAGGRVWLDDEEVTGELRSAAVTGLVSPVSALAAVRHALVELQRRIGEAQARQVPPAAASRVAPRVVVEGRDAGSYIFPGARWRFYLDASLAERARRRLRQIHAQHAGPVSDGRQTAVMEALAQRDRIDRERAFAPLKVPEGATVLDTTRMSLEQVVDAICAAVRAS